MLSFTEPYFLGRRISAGFDIFRQTRTYDKYESELTGATVRFGLPITEALSTQLAYNYSQEEVRLSLRLRHQWRRHLPAVRARYLQRLQGNPGWRCREPVDQVFRVGHAALQHDRRHEEPASGIYANVTTEVAGLGGDAEYVKFTARASYYHDAV